MSILLGRYFWKVPKKVLFSSGGSLKTIGVGKKPGRLGGIDERG